MHGSKAEFLVRPCNRLDAVSMLFDQISSINP